MLIVRPQVHLEMSMSERMHLVNVWCRLKCCPCLPPLSDNVPMTSSPSSSSSRDPTDTSPTLSSPSSSPPPPYSEAVTMPRASAGSTVTFTTGDGTLYELKMSPDDPPPRIVEVETSDEIRLAWTATEAAADSINRTNGSDVTTAVRAADRHEGHQAGQPDNTDLERRQRQQQVGQSVMYVVSGTDTGNINSIR